MQLDKTLVAIRERSVPDILDLALQMSRIHLWPLTVAMCLGAIPLAVVNHVLTGWMMPNAGDMPLLEESIPSLVRFVWTLVLLVLIEAPLAAVVVTSYLGMAVFQPAPPMRSVIREMMPHLTQIASCHLLLRGVLPAWLLMFAAYGRDEYSLAELGLALLTLGVLARRVSAPFLNEIVLLEKNPLRSRNPQVMTARKRIAALHGANLSGLISQGLILATVAVLLAVMVFGTLLCVKGIFLEDWTLSRRMFLVGVPLAMWVTAAFLAVVRFFAYLDLRIRHEGWEVELRLRAEGSRLTEQMP